MTFRTSGALALIALSSVALAGCVTTAPPQPASATQTPVVVQTPAPAENPPSVVVTPRAY